MRFNKYHIELLFVFVCVVLLLLALRHGYVHQENKQITELQLRCEQIEKALNYILPPEVIGRIDKNE